MKLTEPTENKLHTTDDSRRFDVNSATFVLLLLLLVVWPLMSAAVITPDLKEIDALDADLTFAIYLPTIVLQLLILGAISIVTKFERANLRSLWFDRLSLDKVFIGFAFFIAAGLILSILAFGLEYLGLSDFEDPSHLLPTTGAGKLAWFVLCLVVAVCEEAAFRGYALTRLSVIVRSRLAAVLLVSLSFSLGHLYQGLGGVIVIYVYGLMFAALFLKTGSIWPGIIAHFLQDFSPLLLADVLRKTASQ
jgi:membrane protease YdiL (CAAX protease family)